MESTESISDSSLRLIFRGERVLLEWTIQKFSDIASKQDERIQSETVTASDARWALVLFANGENNRNVGRLALYINRLSTEMNRHEVKYKISLKDKNDGDHYTWKGEDVFTNKLVRWGKIIEETNLLLEQKNELFPNDALRVCCDLTIAKVNSENTIDQSEIKKYDGNLSTILCLDSLSDDFAALYGDKESCDMTLTTENKEFYAHSAILGARSSVFAAMLKHDMKEKRNGIIEISDMKADILESLLWFIYSGKVKDVSMEKAVGLYKAADKYAIKELKEECQFFILANLSLNNICDIAVLADIYEDEKLNNSVKHLLRTNVSTVIASSQWNALLRERPVLAALLLQEVCTHLTKDN